MDGRGIAALVSLLAAALGLVIYIMAQDQHQWWPLMLDGVIFLVGTALLFASRFVVKKHPLSGTIMIAGWIVAPTAVGAAVSAAVVWASVFAERGLAVLPKTQGSVVTDAVATLIAAAAGLIIVTALRDPTSWLWPERRTRAAFGRAFRDRFVPDSVPFRAVYENHVPPEGDSPRKEIEGWNLIARTRRARVISRACKAPTIVEAEPPPQPVAGTPGPGGVQRETAASDRDEPTEGGGEGASGGRQHPTCSEDPDML
jgi:hypothetical protein